MSDGYENSRVASNCRTCQKGCLLCECSWGGAGPGGGEAAEPAVLPPTAGLGAPSLPLHPQSVISVHFPLCEVRGTPEGCPTFDYGREDPVTCGGAACSQWVAALCGLLTASFSIQPPVTCKHIHSALPPAVHLLPSEGTQAAR